MRSSISQCKGDDTYHDAYISPASPSEYATRNSSNAIPTTMNLSSMFLNILCNNSSLICLLQAHVCYCREERSSFRCGGVLCPFGYFGVCSIMFVSFAFVDVRTGYRQGQVSKLFEYFNLHPRGTSKNNTEPLDLISLMPHSRPPRTRTLTATFTFRVRSKTGKLTTSSLLLLMQVLAFPFNCHFSFLPSTLLSQLHLLRKCAQILGAAVRLD